MSEAKKFIVLLLVGIWIIQAVSCNNNSTGESEAEQTLEAIYAAETAQAIYSEETKSAESSKSDDDSTSGPASQSKQKPKRPPLNIPDDPPEPERTLADSDSSLRAEEGRTLSGDNFLNNLYERPFTSHEMVYLPDLDIYTVDFSHDEEYFYFTVNLNGLDEEQWRLSGNYGIEFDLTLDGRGDLIVWVENPQKQWSIKNIKAFVDVNDDVGGPQPMIADEGFTGNGYDQRVDFKQVENPAFTRIAPDNSQAVQIAVSNALLEYPEEFLWGAWADKSQKKLSEFDYNDTMGPTEAGSPYIDNEDYPLKALSELDNTCRLPYGFEQMGSSYRGMCITTPPVEQSEPSSDSDNEPDCYCNDYCIDGVTCCGSIICP